jgi:LysM repeat protein
VYIGFPLLSIRMMLLSVRSSVIMTLVNTQKSIWEKLRMKCPNCGATFKGGRGRCPACGFRVEVRRLARRCPVCKARVAEGAKTCLMCGTSLEEGRSFLPRVSLSMVPPAPLLGAMLGVLLLVGIWFIKPWRAIHIRTYNTPTATLTPTSTATVTPTATPTPTLPPMPSPTSEVSTYIVRPGDTLSVIAGQFGVTVEAIMEANDLTDYMIQVGQELLIPVETSDHTPTPVSGETPEPEATEQPETTTYVVQEGDTLSEIADRFNVSQEAIMEANDIANPDSLRLGQELVIPAPPLTSTETPGIGGPPTPTTPSQLVYPAPLLLGPPDEREFRGQNAESPVLLNWLSVGLLGDEEWYSVIIRYVESDEEEEQEIVEFTKANSCHVSAELRPLPEAESHLFEWEVRVVRLIETGAEDKPEAVPIGRRSETRSFYWY